MNRGNIYSMELIEAAVGDTCDLIDMVIEKLEIARRAGVEAMSTGDDSLAMKMYSIIRDVENGLRNAAYDLEDAVGID
jgi:hypothetical protein